MGREPGISCTGLLLLLAGAVVCALLFCLGFLMVKLPFEYSDSYSTGQSLSWVSQGLAIVMITAAAFVDSIYVVMCIRNNFGFLGTVYGRATFYLLMGLYAIPIAEILSDMTHQHNADGWSATFAVAGVVLTFIVGLLHCAFCVQEAVHKPEHRENLAAARVSPTA